MYIPRHFAVTDQARLHQFIKDNGFGILFSHTGPEPMATHIPFVLDTQSGEQGRLLAHVAKANDQWKYADEQQVLVVFQGPHAYVSPTWYEEPETVPTWSYVAVHVYGVLRVAKNREESENILRRLTDYYESFQPQPWQAEFTSEYADNMLKQIVAFEIETLRIQGKWKLNQNHSEGRRRKVADVLKKQTGENDRSIAALIEADL